MDTTHPTVISGRNYQNHKPQGRNSNKDHEGLERLRDFLAEDILAASDASILAETKQDGGDPEVIAASLRALFEKSVTTHKGEKL